MKEDRDRRVGMGDGVGGGDCGVVGVRGARPSVFRGGNLAYHVQPVSEARRAHDARRVSGMPPTRFHNSTATDRASQQAHWS